MIEQGIFFALGCIVTALLGLGFAPIFWNRALRLTRKRLQLQVPLSMQEILAERDQLRAEFAVERLRIEQAMERVKEGKARDMAEIGRMIVEASRRNDEIATARETEVTQGNEISLLRRGAAEAEAEAGALRKALDDAYADSERHQDYARWAHTTHGELRREAADYAAAVAALESRVTELEAALAMAEQAASIRDTRIEDGLRSRLETAVRHAARHEASGVSTRRELDEAKALIRVLEKDAMEARQALDDARDREQAKGAQGSRAAEQFHDARHLDDQGYSIAEALPREGSSRIDPSSRDQDSELRASIHALGVVVAEMMREGSSRVQDRDLRQTEPSRVVETHA